MPALSEYSNVYDTALAIPEAKGFQVWRELVCAFGQGVGFVTSKRPFT